MHACISIKSSLYVWGLSSMSDVVGFGGSCGDVFFLLKILGVLNPDAEEEDDMPSSGSDLFFTFDTVTVGGANISCNPAT